MIKKSLMGPAFMRAIGCLGMVLAVAFLPLAGGCDVLNPAFVDAVAPGSSASVATIDNPPGHVIVAFINNAEVNEQLLAFLETGGNLSLTDAEKRALRPRIRFLVQITSTTGTVTQVEFVSGSDRLVEQDFAATSANDLNQFELNNVVVLCNIARVEVILDSLEVFIPAELEEFELILTTGLGGTQNSEFVLRQQVPPAFRSLQVDQVTDGGTLLSNIGIRDVPGPVVDPLCGSVVAITVEGELSLPFNVVDDNPSYDRDDAAAVAAIGGRFEFNISIQ